jgi:DNA-binding CsgD family transcriptional regulator
MSCPLCAGHHTDQACDRLGPIVGSLEFFAVPAFLTDPLNRVVQVNRLFARLIGDPRRECISHRDSFIPSLMMGPFCDRFPRRYEEIAQCLGGLHREIDSGNLSSATEKLVQSTMQEDDALRRLVFRDPDPWDGTIVVRGNDQKMRLMRETVLPLSDSWGRPNRFHISLWSPVEGAEEEGPQRWPDCLTPRQREVAMLYASGLSSTEVAAHCDIAPRTARDHLEAVYVRLGVHSKLQLARVLAQEPPRAG